MFVNVNCLCDIRVELVTLVRCVIGFKTSLLTAGPLESFTYSKLKM